MKKILISACGIKSKGGITVLKKLLENDKSSNLFVIYDNLELEPLLSNYETLFIKTPRYLQPFLSFYIKRDNPRFINNFDKIIHLGNFAFKTKLETYTFIQNVLPMKNPFGSIRSFILRILYIYTFKISDKIIVQQPHVAKLIPKSTQVEIIGKVEYRNVSQSKKNGFVLIYEDIKNKNPKFLIELIKELSKLNQQIHIINSSINSDLAFLKSLDKNIINIHQNINHFDLINIFKNNSNYIHTSKYETVGLPIFEALENGMKVIVPNEDYINIDNQNIYKYVLGDINSAVEACKNSIESKNDSEAIVPIYYEDWSLI